MGVTMKLWRGVLTVIIIGIIIVVGCYYFGHDGKDNYGEIHDIEETNGNLNQTHNYCIVTEWSWWDSPQGQAVVKESGYVSIINYFSHRLDTIINQKSHYDTSGMEAIKLNKW